MNNPSTRSKLAALPSHALCACLALAVTGCATPPEPATASVAIPSAWADGPYARAGTGSTDSATWWRAFKNPELDSLVSQALQANPDLKMAAARVRQAEALSDEVSADRRPQLGLATSAQNGQDTLLNPRAGLLQFGFKASWEIDLFGAKSLASAAAARDAQAARAARTATEISLAAEVATTYFQAASLSRRHALSEDAIAMLERQLQVARRRFDIGESTRVDIERLRGELQLAIADATALDGSRRIKLRQLAALAGVSHDLEPLGFEGVDTADIPSPPALLPVELLERRPDVQNQARALEAAAARLGVAKADLYPHVQIDWAGSRQELRAEGQGVARGFAIGYGVSLTLPILDGGRIRANIDLHDAAEAEAAAAYEKAILGALADTEIALQQSRAATTGGRQFKQAVITSQEASKHARMLFQAGLAEVGVVLEAERTYLRAQDALAQAREAEWTSAVAVRRAFAGSV